MLFEGPISQLSQLHSMEYGKLFRDVHAACEINIAPTINYPRQKPTLDVEHYTHHFIDNFPIETMAFPHHLEFLLGSCPIFLP